MRKKGNDFAKKETGRKVDLRRGEKYRTQSERAEKWSKGERIRKRGKFVRKERRRDETRKGELEERKISEGNTVEKRKRKKVQRRKKAKKGQVEKQ